MGTLTMPGRGAWTSSKGVRSRGAVRLVVARALVPAGLALACSPATGARGPEAPQATQELKPVPQEEPSEPAFEQPSTEAALLSLPRLEEFSVEAQELLLSDWGAPLAPERYRTSEVLLRPGAKSQVAAGAWALAMVDDFAPRRLRKTRALTLGDLVPEDRELTQGEHLLVVVIGEDSAPPRLMVQVTSFLVGEKAQSVSSESKVPSCRILHPFGTHHGPLSIQGLRFLAVSTGIKKESIEVQVDRRQLVSDGQLPQTGVAYSLGMLDPGDHELTCKVRHNGAGVLRQTITLTPLIVPKQEGRPHRP